MNKNLYLSFSLSDLLFHLDTYMSANKEEKQKLHSFSSSAWRLFSSSFHHNHTMLSANADEGRIFSPRFCVYVPFSFSCAFKFRLRGQITAGAVELNASDAKGSCIIVILS